MKQCESENRTNVVSIVLKKDPKEEVGAELSIVGKIPQPVKWVGHLDRIIGGNAVN